MTVDVVIPVYKPGKKLEKLLTMLAGQSVPPGEIILMNTGEVTFPKRLLHIHPHTRLYQVETEEFDHGVTATCFFCTITFLVVSAMLLEESATL